MIYFPIFILIEFPLIYTCVATGSRSPKRKITSNGEVDKNQELGDKNFYFLRQQLIRVREKVNDDHHFLLRLMPDIQALDSMIKAQISNTNFGNNNF